MKTIANATRGVMVASVAIAIYGCDVDKQIGLTADEARVANPVPSDGINYQEINAAHKVLIAIVDSGIDTNHSKLRANLHFTLDETGKAVGFGYDSIGEDSFSSYRLARTAYRDSAVKPEQQTASAAIITRVQDLLRSAPSLAKYFDPYRDSATEMEKGTYHGTHVAGLASYDRPDIGLIGYRVLPHERGFTGREDHESAWRVRLMTALESASAAGARVVNLSLGGAVNKPNRSEPVSRAVRYQEIRDTAEAFRQFAVSHPNILFVAAAGNDGRWLDDDQVLTSPCGVAAANILCVGALREDQRSIAPFTNIPLSGVDFIFALGEQVLSTVPEDMCRTDDEVQAEFTTLFGDVPPTADKRQEAIATLVAKCGQQQGLARLDGTSMASPIMARQGALVLMDHPEFSGEQVIAALKERSTIRTFPSGFVLRSFEVERPSWYTLLDPSVESPTTSPHRQGIEFLRPSSKSQGTLPRAKGRGTFSFVVNQ